MNPSRHPTVICSEDEDGFESDATLDETVIDGLPGLPERDFTQKPSRVQCKIPWALTWSGLKVSLGDVVELSDGTFLYVRFIERKEKAEDVVISGILLLRNGAINQKYSEKNNHWLYSLLPRMPNDLCAVIKIRDTSSDGTPVDPNKCDIHKTNFFIEVSLEQAVAIRKVIFTNAPLPAFSFWAQGRDYPRKTGNAEQNRRITRRIEDHEDLVLRYKYVEVLGAKGNKPKETKIIRLDDQEAGDAYRVPNVQLLKRTRPVTYPGGKYTYADICAGGGGSTRAAVLARLEPIFLLEVDQHACATLRLNFGKNIVHPIDLRDFCELRPKIPADVMHISFSCQPHSALNRGTNPERDAESIAMGYCLPELIEIFRPRIITMEQVRGVEKRSADGQHLRVYIHTLVRAGYSVQWKVVDWTVYGNVQERCRLIIMAACPGQSLPDWPPHTHAPKQITVRDTLSRIPRNLEPHLTQCPTRSKLWPAHPDRPLRDCITASHGVKATHPWKNRAFNMAETARLVGFPSEHKWPAHLGLGPLTRMMGNTVPAKAFQYFFHMVVGALEATDVAVKKYEEMERLRLEKLPGGTADDPMEID